VRVLEEDLDRNVLGLGAHGLGRGRVDGDLRASHGLGLARDDLAGLLDAPLLDPSL